MTPPVEQLHPRVLGRASVAGLGSAYRNPPTSWARSVIRRCVGHVCHSGERSQGTAFVIEQVGPASTYADHRQVDDVLVRTRPVVYPEIQQVWVPGRFSETVPATADLAIFAWRELA